MMPQNVEEITPTSETYGVYGRYLRRDECEVVVERVHVGLDSLDLVMQLAVAVQQMVLALLQVDHLQRKNRGATPKRL